MNKVMPIILITAAILLGFILIYRTVNMLRHDYEITYIVKNIIVLCIWLLGTILYFTKDIV